MTRSTGAFGLSLFVVLGLLVGCTQTPTSTSSPAAPPVATGDGKAAFTAKCANCHSIGGVGGRRGPDLSHVGAEAEHTSEWLMAYIKNPKSKDPNSRMPPFEGRVTDAELQSLGAYLASQK